MGQKDEKCWKVIKVDKNESLRDLFKAGLLHDKRFS